MPLGLEVAALVQVQAPQAFPRLQGSLLSHLPALSAEVWPRPELVHSLSCRQEKQGSMSWGVCKSLTARAIS